MNVPGDSKKRKAERTQNAEELLDRGREYMVEKKFEQAYKLFERAAELEPENAEVRYHLGIANEARNMIDEAIKDYQESLKYDSRHKLARQRLHNLVGG
jgi:tetratricopeptide (TPR) repeat protein